MSLDQHMNSPEFPAIFRCEGFVECGQISLNGLLSVLGAVGPWVLFAVLLGWFFSYLGSKGIK